MYAQHDIIQLISGYIRDWSSVMLKNNKVKILITLMLSLLLTGCLSKHDTFETSVGSDTPPSRYNQVGVHDPSVVKGEDKIFIVGSHLASATTTDYVSWQLFGQGVQNGNPMIPEVQIDMKEALEWAETTTFWAGDIIQMKDGKYYFYYSVCEGSQPLAAIGYAVSDHVEGPYENKGIIMKSGRVGKLLTYEPDRLIQYDANIHPNAIDPTLFYDENELLWMVYGSYSGGIFLLKIDEDTKMPEAGQGYGTRITGGKHTRIENPYIIYDKDTAYYYFYASFGGLASGDGYQTRVGRSKDIEGPYLDSKGQDMDAIFDIAKPFFDDDAINPFGSKIMGDFEFINSSHKKMGHGYISPGGGSVIYDETLDKTMFVFHARFPNRGEAHEVRTHEIYMSASGWPVVAPIRYSGANFTEMNTDISGQYQFIRNEMVIMGDISISTLLTIENGVANFNGEQAPITQDGNFVSFKLGNVNYEGVSLKQWDVRQQKMVKTITVQGDDNTSIWAIEE